MNNKEALFDGVELQVTSLFETISGEIGVIPQGSRSLFLRLAGCNLRCPWCDAKHSLRKSDGKPISLVHLADKIAKINPFSLVITGGEPLLQQKELYNLLILIKAYHNINPIVQIETHGGIVPTLNQFVECFVIDYKLPSSKEVDKMLSVVHYSFFGIYTVNYIKFVCADREDYEYAIETLWEFEKLYIQQDRRMIEERSLLETDVYKRPMNTYRPMFAFSPCMDENGSFTLNPDTLFKWMNESPLQLMKSAILNIQIHKLLRLGKEEETKYAIPVG